MSADGLDPSTASLGSRLKATLEEEIGHENSKQAFREHLRKTAKEPLSWAVHSARLRI